MQHRPHRYQTQFPVSLATPTGHQHCSILDVNSGGARIMGPRDLQQGDKIKFRVLNDQLAAVVCWAERDQIGVTFTPQISALQVDKLRYRKDMPLNRRRGSVGFTFAEM